MFRNLHKFTLSTISSHHEKKLLHITVSEVSHHILISVNFNAEVLKNSMSVQFSDIKATKNQEIMGSYWFTFP